jgi:hypothetical protein
MSEGEQYDQIVTSVSRAHALGEFPWSEKSKKLMDEIRWDHPKPFSTIYTYPECRSSSSLPHYYFNPVVDTSSLIPTIVEIPSNGFDLNGSSVFDWKWSLASRAVKRAIEMHNCHANRKRLRGLIRGQMQRFGTVDAPMLDAFDRMSMKCLIKHYNSVILLNGIKCARKMAKLHPSFDVTPTMVTRGKVTLIHYTIIPYKFQRESADSDAAGNVYVTLKGVACGTVTGHLRNGFREFMRFGDQNPIRVHRAQLETNGIGQCFIARDLHEASFYKLKKQGLVVAGTVIRVAQSEMSDMPNDSPLTLTSPREDDQGPENDVSVGGDVNDEERNGANRSSTFMIRDAWSFI